MKVIRDHQIMEAIQEGFFHVEDASIEPEGPHPIRVRLVVSLPGGSRELDLAFAYEDAEVERLGQVIRSGGGRY